MSEIIVYSIPGCNDCKTFKMFLRKHKISFIEKEDLMHVYQEYPVVIVDGEQVNRTVFMKKIRRGLLA